jgi:peptide/nickel transport system permease protein
MANGSIDFSADMAGRRGKTGELLALLWKDKLAFISALFLLLVLFCAVLGPILLDGPATRINLLTRNFAPFSFDRGWLFYLGADALGRSVLARIVVGAQNTIVVAVAAVCLATIIGGILGLISGYRGGWVGNALMRGADILMSFPSLLLALVMLYIFGASVVNVILVLGITRIPLYLRTSRAEVLEVRERMFVRAAQAMGARTLRILSRHIVPAVAPTLITLATFEFAGTMLSEATLSFLGLGIQPPEISWGLMVAEGKSYLTTAWWLSFWPGMAITLTTLSLNLLANWLRLVMDPTQRWRLEEAVSEHG